MFFAPGMDVGHERWFVQAGCQGIYVVKKQSKNQQDSIPWNNILQTMRSAKVIERGNGRRWRERKRLVLPVRPVMQGVCAKLVSGGVESRIPVFLGTIE